MTVLYCALKAGLICHTCQYYCDCQTTSGRNSRRSGLRKW